jgi:hypothetical protein
MRFRKKKYKAVYRFAERKSTRRFTGLQKEKVQGGLQVCRKKKYKAVYRFAERKY